MVEKKVDIKNENFLISIIVPIYKVEKFLRNCVDSIITQSYKNLEIILIDDGSPDNCPQICDEYATKDKRVIVIHKQNGGLSDARNVGIKSAKGDYLLFVDSDDMLAQNDVISNLVDFLVKKNSVVTYCSYIIRIDENRCTNNYRKIEKDYYPVTSEELYNIIIKNHFLLAAWTFVIRRSYIFEHSLFFVEELLYEDMEWIPRFLNVDKNLRINIFAKPFYVYRKTPSSITSTFSPIHFNSLHRILTGLIVQIQANPKNKFIISWFNINLYFLFMFFEKDCLSNSNFYKSNIGTVKKFFKENYKFLNFRNRILYIFIKLNPKLFFILRKWVKKVLGR